MLDAFMCCEKIRAHVHSFMRKQNAWSTEKKYAGLPDPHLHNMRNKITKVNKLLWNHSSFKYFSELWYLNMTCHKPNGPHVKVRQLRKLYCASVLFTTIIFFIGKTHFYFHNKFYLVHIIKSACFDKNKNERIYIYLSFWASEIFESKKCDIKVIKINKFSSSLDLIMLMVWMDRGIYLFFSM